MVFIGMRNNIQVFGLPRSGTNFIEYTLRVNILGLDYVPLNDDKLFGSNSDDLIISNNITGSVKHAWPSMDYSDYVIVIYKDYDKWVESIKRKDWYMYPVDYGTYSKYIDYGMSLPKDKCIVVNHDWVVNNYKSFLYMIENKFGYKVKDDWSQPKKRFNMDCGISWSDDNYIE